MEAGAYAATSKMAKGEFLDRLVAEVGWFRLNARRELGNAFKQRSAGLGGGAQPTFDDSYCMTRWRLSSKSGTWRST